MSQTTEERSKLGNNVDTILCDIEGTTTSISFVKDVLFPYVRENLRAYLNEHFEEKECQEDINLLIEHSKTEEPLISGQTKEELIESTIANVLSQMDKDRKTRSLKQLQGHMWKLAYEKGLVKGHIYDDVVPAFERWISRGLKIYIYSSGSVEAQRLLYGYSEKGDLSKYISGNFDTNIGMKVEKSSYENILASLKKSSDNVAFFTDLIREAEAAESAGVQVFLVRRADNPDKETKHFKSIQTFNDVN